MGAHSACLNGQPQGYWSYCPRLWASTLFAVLYGLTFLAHLFQMIYYRYWSAWVITMGAALETLTFILRIYNIYHPYANDVYKTWFVLLLTAPLWMNAFDFMLLGRLTNFRMSDRKLRGIPARHIATLFVSSDVLTFLVQISGAALNTSDSMSTQTAGMRIYTAGVALQQLFIFIFIYLAYTFQRRLSREVEPERAREPRKVLYVLYFSLALISYRIIFRIIEFATPFTSKLSTEIDQHEFFTFVFDAIPMFTALLIFNIAHPGTVLQGPEAKWPKLSKEEKRARKEERKEEKERDKRLKKEYRAAWRGAVANQSGQASPEADSGSEAAWKEERREGVV